MSADIQPFLDVVDRRGRDHADRVAFQLTGDDGRVELTFGGLRERVVRLGVALREAGVEPGDRVAICLENRPAWPVAYLGVWYAGAVGVPVDPALEADAVRRILRHSKAVACITSAALGQRVAEALNGLDEPPDVYNLDAEHDRAWDGESVEAGIEIQGDGSGVGIALEPTDIDADWRPRERDEEELATITYTSGTTGVPKGVMLSRRALVENIDAGLDRIEITEDDHILGILPLFHALPLMANCLGPIYRGARITFLSELNPDRILAAFRELGITKFACVPLFYYRFHDRVMKRLDGLPTLRRLSARLLLRVSSIARRRLGINLGRRFFAAAHEPFGDAMEVLVTGGAKFNPDIYEDFLDLGFSLVQGYGLTEAAAVLTAHPSDELRPTTVGSPVRGVEVRIEKPGDDGVGEILAKSPAVMLGYYRNQDATDEVLSEDGWLRTGDLGRILPDGHLQVTGRAKDMIVLASGKNIYPEELEAHYGQSELVEEICILGIDDPDRQGAERLHAVIVPDLDAARRRGMANLREMIKWDLDSLGAKLPAPQRVTSLQIRNDPLPRTTTRKVKRYELRQQIAERPMEDEGGSGSQEVDEAPPEERGDEAAWVQDVRDAVARHARVEAVRREQHLDLDLGLESLDRVELQAEMEEHFAVEIPDESAGEVQTVGDLIDLIDELRGDEETGAGETAADRWPRVLESTPPDVEPYLRRRPVREALMWSALWLARTLLRLRGLRWRGHENVPDEYPMIVTPNHFSYMDPFVLVMTLPYRVYRRAFFVGYSEYFSGPLGRWASRLFRTIPIDQNRNLERAMQAAAEGLRRDMVLVIFPEGGRSIDGTVKRFRRGTGILARNLDVPVVPVGLSGTFEFWPRHRKYPVPKPVGVVYGKPMRLTADGGAARDSEQEFVDRLRERVIDLVDEAEALYETS